MKPEIKSMLAQYDTTSVTASINALKEVMQEIILGSLSKTDFFDKVAFYGGTALRIFHGLNRFSEDMDFSLKVPDSNFSMDEYINFAQEELNSYGFEMDASTKPKQLISPIKSGFLKGNTLNHLVKVFSMDKIISGVPNNAVISIKIEIDTDPPSGANYERLYRFLPFNFSALLFDLPSLFAGKLHALLCRNWQTREKGRDFYDYVWYLQKGVPLNINHLEQRMRQTGHWKGESNLSKESLIELLNSRFSEVDFNQVVNDVVPYITDYPALSSYSKEFFTTITKQYLKID